MQRKLRFRAMFHNGQWEYSSFRRMSVFWGYEENDLFIPETVTQFTGLKDKNGVEIYELMEINNKYKVVFISPEYVLTSISNGDILSFREVIKNENQLTVTKEYAGI